MARIARCWAAALAFSLFSAPAFSQVDPDLAPLLAPLHPEPRLGLPDQAPDILPVTEPPVTETVLPEAEVQVETPAPAEAPAAAPAPAPARPGVELGGRWASECEGDASGDGACQAIVRGMMGEQVALVLAVAVENGEGKMQMALPLGFAVDKQVSIQLSGYSGEFRVSRCTAQGCLIEGPAARELLTALAEADTQGIVRMANVDDSPIELPLPVEGAGEALTAAGFQMDGDRESQ